MIPATTNGMKISTNIVWNEIIDNTKELIFAEEFAAMMTCSKCMRIL